MNKEIIYLKSLVKNFKPHTETLPKDLLKALNISGIDLFKNKRKDKVSDINSGRDFILAHTEEFLRHVVDYSLDEKINDIINSKKIRRKNLTATRI